MNYKPIINNKKNYQYLTTNMMNYFSTDNMNYVLKNQNGDEDYCVIDDERQRYKI